MSQIWLKVSQVWLKVSQVWLKMSQIWLILLSQVWLILSQIWLSLKTGHFEPGLAQSEPDDIFFYSVVPPLRGEGCIDVGSREPEQLNEFHQSHFFYTILYQNEPGLAHIKSFSQLKFSQMS